MSTLSISRPNSAIFSLDHYEHMVNRGAFAPPYAARVELLHGTVVEKATGERAKFTLEQYEHLIQIGAFDPPFNIPAELLQGEIVMMSPIGEPHSLAVIALTEWSYEVVDRKQAMVRVQAPIRIPATQSEPEPDLVWVRRESAREKPPEPKDVLLLVEVADSSLAYDRTIKLPNYALAGIAEYWIVNLLDEQIEVYRDPSGNTYQQTSIHRGNDPVHPLALPRASFSTARLFGA